jgi:hypothetical protein
MIDKTRHNIGTETHTHTPNNTLKNKPMGKQKRRGRREGERGEKGRQEEKGMEGGGVIQRCW